DAGGEENPFATFAKGPAARDLPAADLHLGAVLAQLLDDHPRPVAEARVAEQALERLGGVVDQLVRAAVHAQPAAHAVAGFDGEACGAEVDAAAGERSGARLEVGEKGGGLPARLQPSGMLVVEREALGQAVDPGGER